MSARQRKFKVGPFIFPIITRGQAHHTGECDVSNHIIYIDEAAPKDLTDEVELHEALHALFDLTGLSHDLEKHVDLEESIVRRLSPALLSFLRDNAAWSRAVIGRQRAS